MTRLLIVADWTVDPGAVIAAARRSDAAELGLVVPARLHGLDWAGDPRASCPCARRQLDVIGRLAAAAGIAFRVARVGDPDPLAAIGDALADWPAQRLLVCERPRRVGPPLGFDVASRARRRTGLLAERLVLPRADEALGGRAGRRLRRGHCEPDVRPAPLPALTP